MIESTYTTRVLTAAEGHFLTQANLESVEGAVISTKVYIIHCFLLVSINPFVVMLLKLK